MRRLLPGMKFLKVIQGGKMADVTETAAGLQKKWYQSRRFWWVVVTAVFVVLQDTTQMDLEPETLFGLVGVVMSLVLGKSVEDAKLRAAALDFLSAQEKTEALKAAVKK